MLYLICYDDLLKINFFAICIELWENAPNLAYLYFRKHILLFFYAGSENATTSLTDLVIHTFLFVLWSYCLCCLYCTVWRREAVSVISAKKSSHRQQNCFIRTYWGILPIVHIYTQYSLRKFQLIENFVICFVLPIVSIKFI